MTLTDANLTELLQKLTPRERRLIEESLREAASLPEDVKSILRWFRRRLKRKARAGKRPAQASALK